MLAENDFGRREDEPPRNQSRFTSAQTPCQAKVQQLDPGASPVARTQHGSHDGTVAILRANAEKVSYWVSEPDRGIYHAWNKALSVVRGDWVYFLGADDYFVDEHAFMRVVPHLLNRPNKTRVVYGRVDLVRTDGSVIGTFGALWNRRKLFELMTLPHQGVFHHRSLFQEHGCFNEEFRIAGDYELLLRELKSRDPLFIENCTIAAMQFGGMSSDGRSAVEALQEIKRARDLNGVMTVSPLWRWALVKAYVRRFLSRMFGQEWTRVAALVLFALFIRLVPELSLRL